MTEILHALRKSEAFKLVDAAALRDMAAHCEERIAEPGDIIVRAESAQEWVIYLAEGELAIYRRNKARDITLLLGIVSAPSLFGDAEWASRSPWLVSVRAETPAHCVLIPKAVFGHLVDTQPRLAAYLYRDACVRHLLANHTAQTIALYSVETRLLRLLFDYGALYGRLEGDRLVIPRNLTQVDMAAALGVNTKTIARTLKPLLARGQVVHDREAGVWHVVGVSAIEQTLPRQLLGLTSRLGDKSRPLPRQWQLGLSKDEDV